jgi:hypothetical protein
MKTVDEILIIMLDPTVDATMKKLELVRWENGIRADQFEIDLKAVDKIIKDAFKKVTP